MFTGLIEGVGEIRSITPSGDGLRVTVSAPGLLDGVSHGDSIAVNGVCLTVVDQQPATSETDPHPGVKETFTADVMAQTVAMSTLGECAPGRPVNLERAMQLGARLGGHIVQGHVDGTATVCEIRPGAQWQVVRVTLPEELAPLVVDKGSITIDGVSLTVSAIGQDWCEVSLIPETLAATTLGQLRVGDRVNLETDIVARHVARMLEWKAGRGE